MNRFPHIVASVVLAQSLIAQTPVVKTGIEVLRERGFDILRGKRVGLITNPTGADSKLNSTIDILHNAKEVNLVALFGPEHGVRGDHAAGDKVDSYKDEETRLPVYSLYGQNRKPTQQMLKDIDVLIYDIQDIGCRSYTFISTMGLAMEAAAENDIEFVVLDRPNPLGGERIEGNIVEPPFVSFISQFSIPYVYGLTCGELASFLNEEGMLGNGVKCKLTVVAMEGWKRSMLFAETGLPWVPPSPHVPTAVTVMYVVGTGLLGELGVISEGIGYTSPFQVFAATWIDPYPLANKLNSLHIDGVLFRPMVFRPLYGKWKDSTLAGVQLHITNPSLRDLMGLQFLFMQVHNELYPQENPFLMADSPKLRAFDKAVGTDQVRRGFSARMRYEDIVAYLQKDVETFRAQSRRYWLYQ